MTDASDDRSPTKGEIEAKAVRLLGRRGHAREELARKLRRNEYPDELIEQVLDTLEDQGYIDDERFAREQGAILARKCWGPTQIAYKLKKRGVDDAAIDGALAAIEEDENWEQRADERLRSRFGDPDELDEDDVGRAYRHLTRRGYRPGLVRRLLFD